MNTPKEERKAEVIKLFKPPFITGGGYIFDKNNQMVAETRAWGYLQYKPNGEELQDTLGEIIAESLTNYYKTSHNLEISQLLKQLEFETEIKKQLAERVKELEDALRKISTISNNTDWEPGRFVVECQTIAIQSLNTGGGK